MKSRTATSYGSCETGWRHARQPNLPITTFLALGRWRSDLNERIRPVTTRTLIARQPYSGNVSVDLKLIDRKRAHEHHVDPRRGCAAFAPKSFPSRSSAVAPN